MRYDAFISYSHAADGRLAPALQTALHRLAKPWYRRRALRIFRDQTSLAATPELWPTIQRALDTSRYFLLLASPDAAESRWVRQEVAHWLTHRSSQELLIVWTDGTLSWDDAAGDFDWDETNALPSELRGVFTSEPLWVDLRWARQEEQLSPTHPRFQETVADLAAPLHGQPKEDLLGEDVRQHKRTLRLAGTAATLLVVLLVVAVVAAIVAAGQRDEARTQREEAHRQAATAVAERRVALTRGLAAQAQVMDPSERDRALLLGLEAHALDPADISGRSSVLTTLVKSRRMVAFLHGHTGGVRAVTYSPGGDLIASAGLDGTTILWDARTHQPIGSPLSGHQGAVWTVAFSPDGQRLVTGGEDGAIIVWDVATHAAVGTSVAAHTDGVVHVVFSPDGTRLISGGEDGTVIVWNPATGQPLGEPLVDRDAGVTDLVFAPNGQMVAASYDETDSAIDLFDPVNGELVGQLDSYALGLTRADSVQTVVFSPNGTLLVAGLGSGKLIFWDVTTGTPRSEALDAHHGPRGGVLAAVFSPGGEYLVSTGGDGWALVWDVAARSIAWDWQITVSGGIFDIAHRPTGTEVVTATGGEHGGVVLWELAQMSAVADVIPVEYPIKALSTGPGGKLVAAGRTDGTIALWDATTGKELAEPLQDREESIESVAISPDGTLLAASGSSRETNIWDLTTRQRLGSVTVPVLVVSQILFSPDGRVLATGDYDGTIVFWDVATLTQIGDPLVVNTGSSRQVTSLAFNPEGNVLATGSWDGAVRFWDVATGQPAGASLNGHEGAVTSIAFSPDGGLLVTAGWDGIIVFWDAAARTRIGEPLAAHGRLHRVAFSLDGTMLVSTGDDGGVAFWDVRTRQRIGNEMAINTGQVFDAVFVTGGSRVATGDGFSNLVFWDASVEAWRATACRIANRNLTREEWQTYLGTEPYHETCPVGANGRSEDEATPVPNTATPMPVATTPTPAATPAANPTRLSTGPPLDLAAMLPMPSDLGTDFGVVSSYAGNLDNLVRSLVTVLARPESEIRATLTEAGWERIHELGFAAPADSTGETFRRRITVSVTEYASDEGAISGFTLLEDESRSSASTPPYDLAPSRLFGEQAEITVSRGVTSTGASYVSANLTFRVGRLVGDVRVTDFAEQDPLPEVEAVGTRLLARMLQELEDDAPGLSTRVLRLTGEMLDAGDDGDRYRRRAGEEVTTYDDAVERLGLAGTPLVGTPVNTSWPIWDHYQVFTGIGEQQPRPLYQVDLYAYRGDQDASGAFARLTRGALTPPERGEAILIRSRVEDAPVYGDESVTITKSRMVKDVGDPDRYRLNGYEIWARVGSVIFRIEVMTTEQRLPLHVAQTLAAAQVACLRSTGVCAPVPVPSALLIPSTSTPEPTTEP